MAIYSETAGKKVQRYSRDYGFRLSKVHTINQVDPDRMERFLRARRIGCERPDCKKQAVGMSATRVVAYLCDDDLNVAEDIQKELAQPLVETLAYWTEWYMTHEYRGTQPGVVVVGPDTSIPILDVGRIAASGANVLEKANVLPTVDAPTRTPSGVVVLPPLMVF